MNTPKDPQFVYLAWLASPVQSVAVLSFTHPNLTEELNIEQLAQELNLLIDHFEYEKIVLSFKPVNILTSSVLGKLISLHRRLKRLSGALVMCDFSPPLVDILVTSHLDNYFQITGSLDEAIEQVSA